MKSHKYKKRTTTLISAVLITLTTSAQANAPVVVAPQKVTIKLSPKMYAEQQVKSYGWHSKHYSCLEKLWTKESNWNHKSDNPKSSAYGIAQMLKEKSKNPLKQIDNGLRYIKHRYENPCNAWSFWRSNYWY